MFISSEAEILKPFALIFMELKKKKKKAKEKRGGEGGGWVGLGWV